MNNADRHNHPMLVVTIVALMSFLGILVETSMNVTFPALMQEFHESLNTVQWVTAGYLLAAALVMLTSAYMKHRFTNRQLFVTGAMLFCIGDLICGLAPVFWVLLVGRLIQAGCVGVCTPLMVNIILDVVPRAKLGTYIGIANLITLVAPAMGPTFGGAVVTVSSWRMIFWSTLPFALILMMSGFKQVKQYTPIDKNYQFDWGRFAVLSVALISLIVGLNTLETANYLEFSGLMLLSAILVAVFIMTAGRTAAYLFSLKVFRNAAFLFSFLPYVLLQFSNNGINFLLPNYVQTVFGASSLIGGLILLPGSLFNSFGQPVYGWMLDHFGGKLPLYLGTILFTVGLIILALMGPALGAVGVAGAYLVFAIGRSMSFGNSVAYGLQNMPTAMQNDANALYNTGQQVAGAIGTTVLALIANMVHHTNATNAENIAAGSHIAFMGLVLLGFVIILLFHHLLNLPTQDRLE